MKEYLIFYELPENLKETHETQTKYGITKQDANNYWIGKIPVSKKDSDKYIVREWQYFN